MPPSARECSSRTSAIKRVQTRLRRHADVAEKTDNKIAFARSIKNPAPHPTAVEIIKINHNVYDDDDDTMAEFEGNDVVAGMHTHTRRDSRAASIIPNNSNECLPTGGECRRTTQLTTVHVMLYCRRYDFQYTSSTGTGTLTGYRVAIVGPGNILRSSPWQAPSWQRENVWIDPNSTTVRWIVRARTYVYTYSYGVKVFAPFCSLFYRKTVRTGFPSRYRHILFVCGLSFENPAPPTSDHPVFPNSRSRTDVSERARLGTRKTCLLPRLLNRVIFRSMHENNTNDTRSETKTRGPSNIRHRR